MYKADSALIHAGSFSPLDANRYQPSAYSVVRDHNLNPDFIKLSFETETKTFVPSTRELKSARLGKREIEENLEEDRTASEEKDKRTDSVTGNRASMSMTESISEPCEDYCAITWFLNPLLQVWMENFMPVAIGTN